MLLDTATLRVITFFLFVCVFLTGVPVALGSDFNPNAFCLSMVSQSLVVDVKIFMLCKCYCRKILTR